jgi:hypothetical protein
MSNGEWTERKSDFAVCKRMVEQLYDDLLAVGKIVRAAYGQEVSDQLFLASAVLNDPHGELERLFDKIKLQPGPAIDVHAELERRRQRAQIIDR